MNPPVYYILIVLVLTSGMISLIFFIAWKNLVREPHTLSWSLAFLCAMVQWLCTLGRPLFPTFESYWLVVNAFSLALITLGLRGHAERTRAGFMPRKLWPYGLFAYAVVAWTTLVNPHVGVSTAVAPLAAAITLLLSAYLVLHYRPKTRPAELAAAVTMILFGCIQAIAVGLALLQGSAGDPAYRLTYYEFNFLTLPAGYIGVAMFTIFMLASDMSEQMRKIAVLDQLTGLLNRRGFGEQSAKTFATARRTGQPLAVIMTDIDRFKDINDEYGHAVGDLALQHFAHVLTTRRRADDVVARMGGEEFAVVLPGTTLPDAVDIAEALCDRIESEPLVVDDAPLSMTASFGVATLSARDTCIADVVVRADRALYRSKRSGRNRVDIESSQKLDLQSRRRPVATQ